MLIKIFLLLLCLNVCVTADEEVTPNNGGNATTTATTTTLIPNTTQTESTSTTESIIVVFDRPEVVTNEINKAWHNLNKTVHDSIKNFMNHSREKLENEVLQIFSDLEKVDSFDKFEKLCPHGMVTAYEEFQTANNGLSSRWILIEHGKIDDVIAEIFRNFLTPFQRRVRAELEAPITTRLRFPRGNLERFVDCARRGVPMILNYIKKAFDNVVECLVLDMEYEEIVAYHENITQMYEETAGFITTCNAVPSCLRRYCPKFHHLVLKTVEKAADAINIIMVNFRAEVANITSCTRNKFSEREFSQNLTTISTEIRSCLG